MGLEYAPLTACIFHHYVVPRCEIESEDRLF